MRWVVAALCVCVSTPAVAQDAVGAGKLELTLIPGGWLSFATADERPEPGFGQYVLGGSITFNAGPVGIEGELTLALGRTQDLDFGSGAQSLRTPNVVVDFVNLVVPILGNQRTVVPYVTAGIGEFTVMRSQEGQTDRVQQPDTETFFSGDFGGGVKWYSAGRWGIRVDYRYSVMRSRFDAPGPFFGREQRRINRVYGGVLVNLIQ